MPKVEKPLTTYADHYLICRDIGHAWIEDERTIRKIKGVGSYVRVLGCGRCNMSRTETLNYRGELMFREYSRPKGYAIGRTPVSEIRKERIARARAEVIPEPKPPRRKSRR